MKEILDYQLFRIGETSVTTASLAMSLLLLVGSYLLARLVRSLVTNRLFSRTHLSSGARYMLGRFTGYLVFFLGAAVALQTIGIRATMLTAFGAALGVGIGIGLQDIVKNFVAGLIILIERPFQVGDRIKMGPLTAEVKEIRPRATVLRTNDDAHLIVPNAKLIGDTIVNRSFDRPLFRLGVPVGVSNGSDPRAVEEALLEAARACDGVLSEPPPAVRFRGFRDSALNFEVLCWTDRMVHRPGALASSLNFLVYDTLKKKGIDLPSPQTDVRIRGAEGLELFASHLETGAGKR